MNRSLIFLQTALLGGLLLASTGCFRVGSETRALRDAALQNGLTETEERIELALGRLAFATANFGLGFVESNDIPPEARVLLRSVKSAEVSVHHFQERTGDLGTILAEADKALEKRGHERLIGVINENQLVAIYVPRNMRSARNIRFHLLVLNEQELVCIGASGDVYSLMDLAMEKARQQMPPAKLALNQ